MLIELKLFGLSFAYMATNGRQVVRDDFLKFTYHFRCPKLYEKLQLQVFRLDHMITLPSQVIQNRSDFGVSTLLQVEPPFHGSADESRVTIVLSMDLSMLKNLKPKSMPQEGSPILQRICCGP